MLSEVTTLEEKNQTLHTFRFRGVDVERRQVNSPGRPIDGQGAVVTTPDGGWGEPARSSGRLCGTHRPQRRREQAEPETLFQKVALPGLTLPKLPTVGEKRTPPVDEYPKAVDDHGTAPGRGVANRSRTTTWKPLPFETTWRA